MRLPYYIRAHRLHKGTPFKKLLSTVVKYRTKVSAAKIIILVFSGVYKVAEKRRETEVLTKVFFLFISVPFALHNSKYLSGS